MTTHSAGPVRPARAHGRGADRADGRDWDGVQFRTILLLCLPAHLAAAAAARLTPAFWSDARARASLFAEAWRASGTTARIALSG